MQDTERLNNKRGIDKEIQAKLAAKFDVKKASNCLEWIQACTGTVTTGDFGADLRNGYLLLLLLKHISPKTMKKLKAKPKQTKQPFVCRTQIQTFVAGCKELGMVDSDVLTSTDLYEGDNMNNVVNCLYALNALCFKLESKGKYKGPFLPGAHSKFATKNKRHFTEAQLNHAKYMIPKQSQGGIQDDSKTDHDAYGIIKTSAVSGAKGVVPKLAQGRGEAETSNFDSYGIVKCADKPTGGVPLLSQSGAEVQTSNFDSYGIVKKADDDVKMKTIAKADV